jgi:hypothetical protein
MKDPSNREMMAELYRLFEKFEVPTEDEQFWENLNCACINFCTKWESNPVASCLCVGWAEGMERLYWKRKRAVPAG